MLTSRIFTGMRSDKLKPNRNKFTAYALRNGKVWRDMPPAENRKTRFKMREMK